MHTTRVIDSPIGPVTIEASGRGITRIAFAAEECRSDEGSSLIADTAAAQLEEYFSGGRTDFDLPLAPQGTDFQRTVWDELLRIPFGETTSYGELARRIGRPTASRAVGAANGANPIAIVIPCHRVIDSRGRLHGYAGGIERKQKLLELEGGHVGAAGGLFASQPPRSTPISGTLRAC